MNDGPHVIEIDSIVLNGVQLLSPGRVRALIEAEVTRVLAASARPATTPGRSDAIVAGEIARTVVRSIHGGADGV